MIALSIYKRVKMCKKILSLNGKYGFYGKTKQSKTTFFSLDKCVFESNTVNLNPTDDSEISAIIKQSKGSNTSR